MSMKKNLLLFLFILLSSCRPEPTNDGETLNKIVNSDSFNLEIQILGCFRGETDHFTLEKQEKGYLLTCKETNKSNFLSNENQAAFKSLLFKLITSNNKNENHNSGYFRIKASTFFNAVEYDKSDEWFEFNKILKFSRIVPEP